MMAIELRIPEIGESITEVIIAEWLKNENDEVERDEDLVVIETEKATVEIPAPQSGRLVKILKRSGETAAVGEAVGLLDSKTAGDTDSMGASRKPEEINTAARAENNTEAKKVPERAQTGEEGSEGDPPHAGHAKPDATEKDLNDRDTQVKSVDTREQERDEGEEEEISKAPEVETRKRQSMDHESIERKTRVAKKPAKDEDEVTEPSKTAWQPKIISRAQASDDREAIVENVRADQQEEPRAVPTESTGREEQIVPMSPIRKRIAERLVHAQQTTAFLSTFNEIDMSAVSVIRQRYQENFQGKYHIKLGFMSFFVKASIEALKLIPQVNAEIRGADIVYRNYYDIGVAVGGGKGLVVPVLRNAERMSFPEIEQAIQEFAQKAENNQLKPGDLVGGTFTISNGGIYGSLLSTPIINAPQSGILGMHAIQERPVARDGQVVIRPMMYVALTYDHRIVDGREAVTFLKRIKECVEEPSRILLGI